MYNFFLVAIGGAFGASFRYIVTFYFKAFYYPFIGTLIVNIIGSFLIGCFIYLIQNKIFNEDFIKYFLIIGVLGSFTTFSAFSYETINLIQNNKLFMSSINIILSVSVCVLAAYIGLNVGKIIN